MTHPINSDPEFIELFRANGGKKTADLLGMSIRGVMKRRKSIEDKSGVLIAAPHRTTRDPIEYPGRLHMEIENGLVLVASDQHYWPGEPTTAHRAFVKFCRDYAPVLVVSNGDAFDGASISRHAPLGWEKRPSVIQELETCQERHGEIEDAAKKARKIWNLGNHDARFEARLATVGPEYANVPGVHLKDHFRAWENAWSCWINNDVVIKHRWKGGLHAVHNNTVNSGKTVVTGHLHSLKVTPWSDYSGTRFGVDTGTMADPFGPQFEYIEDNPRNWRSGFAVLTFRNGRLMWPELVHVLEPGLVEFRGELIEV